MGASPPAPETPAGSAMNAPGALSIACDPYRTAFWWASKRSLPTTLSLLRACLEPCRQPVRIVLDSGLRLSATSHLARTAREVPVWVACSEAAPRQREEELTASRCGSAQIARHKGRIDLSSLLCECGKRGLTSLLVEGGGRVLGDFLENRLADEFLFLLRPQDPGRPSSRSHASGPAQEEYLRGPAGL